MYSPALAQELSTADLEREHARIQAEVNEAAKAYQSSGGVIQNILGVRLEVLKLSLALVDQRRLAVGSGAKTDLVVPASTPDPERAVKLEQEIRMLDGKLAATEQEAEKNRGSRRYDDKRAGSHRTVKHCDVAG